MVIAASALALTACGDSTASYSLSGAISGLSADGLVLVNNGVTVTPSSGATSFVAATVFQTGQTYAVTVQTQPTGLVCSVADGAQKNPQPMTAGRDRRLTCDISRQLYWASPA